MLNGVCLSGLVFRKGYEVLRVAWSRGIRDEFSVVYFPAEKDIGGRVVRVEPYGVEKREA